MKCSGSRRIERDRLAALGVSWQSRFVSKSRTSRQTPEGTGERLHRLRSEIEGRIGPDASGVALCRAMSDGVDAMVLDFLKPYAQTFLEHPFAVVATGGWGRQELCPYSDIDVMFLSGERTDEGILKFSEPILYAFWDAKLDVGHAIRALWEVKCLAEEDLPTATAVLDSRFIFGDARVVSAMQEQFRAGLATKFGMRKFLDQIRSQQRVRHAKFDESVYLLEPNVKFGAGSLRDLACARWLARARWSASGTGELVALGVMSKRQGDAFLRGHDFFLRVRSAMHMAAGRRQDQLTFELQEEIAPVLYPSVRRTEGDTRSAVAPAVEALMREYYLVARAIDQGTARLLEKAQSMQRGKPRIKSIDGNYKLFNARVSVARPDLFRERPAEMLGVFRLALDLGVKLNSATRDLIFEQVARNGPSLSQNRDAKRVFLELLMDARSRGRPTVLEELHELGILNALVPEFEPCTGRVQHDLYHIYTVDQHQIYAVAMLKRLVRGEVAETLPEEVEAMKHEAGSRPLFLATLLHDIGKPLGKGHAEKGACLAKTIALRLGLTESEAAQTEFLVQHHLLMSHISQRRDLQDLSMVARFAGTVKTKSRLRQLYLLTYCDSLMTNPEIMTEWKETLLTQLYRVTLEFLEKGEAKAAEAMQAQANNCLKQVEAELRAASKWTPKVSDWLAGLPERYFSELTPAEVLRHSELATNRSEGEVLVVPSAGEAERTEVFVLAPDQTGLLAKIAGVMAAHRIAILEARIFSGVAVSPKDKPTALDVFWVQGETGKRISAKDRRWKRVAADLRKALTQDDVVDGLLAKRRSASRLRERVVPEVPVEIHIDNQVADRFTVIDVFAEDRLGLLYAVTKTITELQLDIAVSRVATEGHRVADVFYVRDMATGDKIRNPKRQERIRETLKSAICKLL